MSLTGIFQEFLIQAMTISIFNHLRTVRLRNPLQWRRQRWVYETQDLQNELILGSSNRRVKQTSCLVVFHFYHH